LIQNTKATPTSTSTPIANSDLNRRISLSHRTPPGSFLFGYQLSVLYVISPVDLLPEAVLGVVGLIDDFAVIMFILVVVAGLYEAMVLARARREE